MQHPINEPLWQQLTQEVMTGMCDWHIQHSTATLREIETELDALGRMRARMLEDLALQSAATAWQELRPGQQPSIRTVARRSSTRPPARTLQTHGGQELTLERSYGVCPACGTGLFPPR